ncbi:MAG: endopeptidase La [Lentimicrobiaceae bacterium]|jgi:ATP-dependent Lon protease|nr:endopeptidase La [Lentimicrobiaceae bacterium]MDD4597048.1 endopeptidase La [Lentimicrobiaceae bacterium]MDY0024791.1 endopeptidase La [Lentimicrobium sp.]HAH59143.1 endopeptidase La [Bacteroidales bacterium]
MSDNSFGFTEMIENETEFIPLLSAEDEEQMNAEEVPDTLPILPLRNTVLFPGVVIPITVGRDKSIKLIKDYYKGDRLIGAVAQKDFEIEDPSFSDLNEIGTIAYIIKLLQMPDGSTTAIIQGKKRFRIMAMLQEDPYFMARVSQFDAAKKPVKDKKFNALMASIKDLAIQIINLSPNLPSDSVFAIRNIESPVFLVNFICSNLNVSLEEKQMLLAIDDLVERANMVLGLLTRELQIIELKNQIQSKVKIDLDKQQRDYLLNQQLKTIQDELGGNPHTQEIGELKERAAKKKWNENVAEVFEKELGKLQRMNPAAMEYSMQMNYLDVLIELPWNEYTIDNFDLKHARKVLDSDHFGLEEVKDRILEYLAVLKLKGDMKSPILCLFGPPGVGKTSLGRSIANAVGRKYIRMSLGGLRDEAEIRGHRKTYIGAMPGRILQSIRKAKASNPVFVLDEIDKVIGANISGDPSAALLEVLDPEQNNSFYDNFVELEYDLSKVMFIATANNLSAIHPALRDRMEVIEINGYLLEEKVEIARRHLVPKQLAEHGVKKSQIVFSKKMLEFIIEYYTRESGVRDLEKKIAKVIRYLARFIVSGEEYNVNITVEDLHKILGSPRYNKERDSHPHAPGVVTGLAWTQVGGEILYVESSLSHGKGNLGITGNLGEVMKESATLAYEYLKSHSKDLGLEPEVFEKWNVHIHIPEGATPKDGPSAGIAMFTAIASAFTQRLIKPRTAMTGEITLRGKVLPVGGIKEKILAARRAGIQDIILPKENEKDINEIKPVYLKGLNFHYVSQMIEVINLALTTKKAASPLKINY